MLPDQRKDEPRTDALLCFCTRVLSSGRRLHQESIEQVSAGETHGNTDVRHWQQALLRGFPPQCWPSAFISLRYDKLQTHRCVLITVSCQRWASCNSLEVLVINLPHYFHLPFCLGASLSACLGAALPQSTASRGGETGCECKHWGWPKPCCCVMDGSGFFYFNDHNNMFYLYSTYLHGNMSTLCASVKWEMTANGLKTKIHLEMRENNQMNHRPKQWRIIILKTP